ncbi:MAG: InlB B-repeat-containing protein [Ruthenibacterium lactatiformans]|nr:InlB B-repeat-containing protein [Ruthenibacterium lactatiformans]MEE1462294.1 InlB B-repeat-containing protein [Ruthenibacterium lactatiformans]
MKNTSNALRRVMSVVLVFAMMFTSMPTGALAEDVVDPAPSTTAAEPAASETTEPTTPEPASSEAAPAANSAVLPANDGDPAPVTFTVTFVANGETLVTQTIQQGGSAVAPDAPLVSGQRFVRWDTDFTNVQSDLTVTAVYEAITAKNMTVEYRYSDGTQAAPSHVEQAVVGEPFHKTVPSPALDGFTPDKAEVVFAVESVTEDLTVVVTYSGAARNYTVKHLFQNVEGTAYAEDEALRETLEGTTGLDTAAQAKTVEGFTALPITQVKVASSGETVVEVKYDRNSYLLTWNTDGGSYIEPQMLKYGAAVSAPADPTKVGYTFAGWDFVPETMPAAATTVTAQWANATQASYQVVYWGENLTGGYDYLYADKATGAVGGNIPYSTSLTGSRMPQGLEAAGFELDSAKSAGNVEITADGSAVKNVYFSRRTFTISFYRYSKRQWREDTSLRITAKYGEDVSARWETACEDDGWGPNKNDNIQYTLIANMPAENLTMYEKSSGTGTTIEYRVEKINGSGYDVYATFKASSGVHLTDEDKMPITGFAYDSWKQYTNGWGDSTLWLYYTRNSYNLVFENCTGVSPRALKFEAPLSGAKPADSSVGRPAGMDSDYVFMGWYLDEAFQTPVDWSSTMPARNLQVYAKWAKPDYTVSFNTHGADTETPAPIGVAKYDTIEDQMPADPTREGYVFAGWYTDEAYTVPFVATQQIVRNLTLHAKWTRTDSCTYVIVAKDTEGNELKRVDGSEVEVGASVTVNAPVIDGYQAQQSSQNVKILDDGQEVVFVYDKLQNWTATVHHYIEGTTEKVAEDVIRSDLTVNSLLVYSATVSGYELAEGTSYVQTATRENSEITFYYKKIADSAYTVNHYYGSNASLTETVTGTAKAGSLVTADVINKAGYTCVTSGAALSAYVAKDGSTVINVYYAANDQTYSVYYYLEGTETPVPGTTAKENVSAKFDETVTETAPAVTGYTVAGDSTMSITVGADNAANKIVFYYTVNSYPLNITYKYADDVPDAALRGQKAAEPVSRDIAFGAPYSVASPLIPGYTASVAAVAGTMAENGVTVEVVYRAATDTAYTVKHMLQDVTGDGYTEDAAARQTLHGTTGAATNAAAKSYEGFTAQAVEQKTIAADSSTVVEIKYDRNSYEVTYAYVGTAPAGASALPEKATVKYGAPVAVAAAATAPGYTFSGWSQKEDFTMPAENVTITGSFTANGDTAYTVEHYQQNLAGDGYDLVETDTEHLKGETDTTATANPKTYTGFTFDGTVEGTVASGNIAGDGSLVLKLYYTRNSYEVSYAYTGTVPAGASALPATASYKYGADVTVAPQATAPGYTFNGWLEDGKVTASFKMPAGPVQLTGSFTANTDTRYTVEHWTEDLDGEGYTLRETEANLTGVTDTTATAEAKSYEGFRFDEGNENNVLTGVITGDGKLVLKVYYARNSYEVSYDYGAAPTGASQLPGTVSYKYGAEVRVADKATAPGYTFDGWKKDNAEVTSFTMPAGAVQLTGRFTANTDTGYKVEHYQQNLAGDAFVLFETEEQNATTDTHVSATPKDYTGFTYDGTVDGTVTEGNVAGDGSLVLKLYYTRDSYKVTYQYTGKVPTGASELPAETTEKYGAAVTVAADATAPGYTFSGWSREDGFTMPAENVTITGSFTANGETPYKVEHYQQNLEDDGYTLAETENLTGETDTTATANPKTYTGFAFDGTAEGTVASGNIAGDGSLVLKLYYTRNSYDVAYAYTGTVPTGASALPEKATVKYGAPVTVAEAATAPGYTFSGWSRNDFTMPAENVTITGSFTANSNTEYTVRHHFQNILDDAYDADTAMLSETLSGTTDTLTAAAAKTVAGFTAQSFQQKNIAGDGSTVVDIYYNRNSYGVSYRYLNTPAGASALPAGASYRFGAAVTVAEAATAPGYTFSGWSTGDFTMPAQDVEITGSFTANGDTAYTVEHYQQNLAGDGYDLVEVDTEHLTGETDTTATANPKAYTGFTFDGTVEGTVASGNIAGDGSLVLKLYYTRNSYDVTYAYTGTVPADASALPEKAAVKYGASVTVAEAATAKGHTFSGWSTGDFTMPAQDVEITGSFTANPYNVTVEYYFDKAQDTDMTRVQSVTYGETFTTAAAAETDRNGVHYTLDWVENNGLTVSDIEADNVVRVYYAKDEEGGPDDIPDYAQIVFTYQSADVRKGTVDKSVEIHTFERLNGELLEEKKASPAGANAAGREGYAFDYWTDGTKRDVTSGMETLKSEVYTDNAEFTAYFDVDTKGTDPENPDKPDNVPDKYQAKVTYQAVNGAVTLGGSMGTELVTYVTLFDADGKWAENGTGKLAEAQVPTAAAAADYDPATERWTPAVPAEGAEITADGAVFTVTWELAISGYQVHYYYDGVEDTASAVNATGKIGDAIPYDTGKTTFDGANYVLENVDGAGKLISKDAAANIVNVNFTKDEKSDPTKDPDPEVPGDNIPDKYQATVTFEAINGVLQPKGGTDAQNTKQMTTVVTLLNENGEPAENGTGYLTEAQIPTALANLGYIANTLFWGPATPTTSYAITGDITFVADFNAEGVIPEEPPVPPVTPVGPTAPEEGPEETIDEPETPLAPAEPEAPAEEPAEEEIEEADTPLASGAAWALLNLILMLCTALVSILLLIGFLGKKKKEDENENVEYTVKRKGVTRVLSLIPAIGSIIAFLLTENMRNPMVFVDRWTWLMVLIALVQVIVCIFARKEKEEPDDNAQTPAQA